ncbi:MAG: enoyl-CoA hydratase/isomerase family protein [Propionibacteriaceae bacterium]
MTLEPVTNGDVLAGVEDGVGRLVLHRPRAINALTPGMIDDLANRLTAWADDDRVECVVLTGAGERGLCSGADVRALREFALAGDPAVDDFFRREYRVNAQIATYPKPYEARMTGITMGGGLGVSAHGSARVVDATSQLAMPETGIGLFPDVGMLWHLSRAGAAGLFVALTGLPVDGATALALGLADTWQGDGDPTDAKLDQGWVTECFSAAGPVEILGRLDGDWDTPAPGEVAEVLRSRCPLSVAVTWEALRRAAVLDLDQVLAQDYILATYFAHHADFAEGVRAQLVDKDRSPQWSHASLESVTPADIATAFGE